MLWVTLYELRTPLSGNSQTQTGTENGSDNMIFKKKNSRWNRKSTETENEMTGILKSHLDEETLTMLGQFTLQRTQ